VKISRALYWLTALVAAGGAIVFYRVYQPGSLGEALDQLLAYAHHPGTALALGAGALSLALFGVARIVEKRPLPTVEPPAPGPAAPIEADLLAAMLADLAARMKAQIEAPKPEAIAFVDTMLDGGVRVRASDVHLHPLESATNVAFRVQGILEEVMRFPPEHHRQVIARLKVLARLNTFRTDMPQDGHFSTETSAGATDVRVSVLPTNHGEKVVLRIASTGVEVPDLGSLGLPMDLADRYRRILARPQGLVFVTGPTGSGKTTTIYGSLGHIKKVRGETTQIVTVEDPIEYDLPFLTQTQVKAEVGLTFAQGLRSILRQDPNVIMVGEIRDPETAHIAIQAGLTGHQIVTTVHADSAAGAFNRIIEMGVEPFLVASASLASLSQRLVRALCPHCRVPAVPDLDEKKWLMERGLDENGFFGAPGCKRCGQTGYLGRRAIFELLEMTPRIRDLIHSKVPTARIHEAAIDEGMVPLLAAAMALALDGGTSLREVVRVVG
jgi:general secretion pathway protein E